MAYDVTVAGVSANGYASVAEADAYVAYRASAAWTAAITATKETYLQAAAAAMERWHYKGAKSSTTQALRFPSTHHTNLTTGAVEVRTHIKRAQSFLALMLLEDPELLDGQSSTADGVSVVGAFSVSGMKGDPMGIPRLVYQEIAPELLTVAEGAGLTWNGALRAWV